MIYRFADKTPKLGRGAFVAPSAAVIGDVEIGEEASIWFNCTVRGDLNGVTIGKRSNIQDGAVIHISSGNSGSAPGTTTIGDRVTIGHGAIIHACTLEDECLIGMGAIILDAAVVKSGAFVAAGAFVAPGAVVGAGELWVGSPAVKKRRVGEKERQMLKKTPDAYAELAKRYISDSEAVNG